MKKMTRFLCTLLAVCMLCGIPSMTSEAAVVERGIDVSKWQGPINWQAVAQSGVTFAFIRVGNTLKGIDEYFYYNMLAAQQAGIKTGVYIYSYAKNVQEAAMEAQFVLNAIQNVQVSYPVVWDVEDNVHKSLSPEMLSLMANTFCATIEAEGYYPMVYSSANWYKDRIGPVFYDKWVAQWAATCDIPDAAVWQYTSKGRVPGISGDVDLDEWYALIPTIPPAENPQNPYKDSGRLLKYNPLTVGIPRDDVRWLQWELREAGYQLQVDGRFGPKTDLALRAFQAAHGLKADGKCGPATRAALRGNVG